MSYDDDDRPGINERATAKRVQQSLQELHRQRQEFTRASQAGRVDERDRLAMQARIIDCIEALRPYRDRVGDQWQQATRFEDEGLGQLPYVLRPREIQKRSHNGFGRTQIQTTTEPRTLSVGHLLEISEEIDDMAKEIGFEPAPEKTAKKIDGGIA